MNARRKGSIGRDAVRKTAARTRGGDAGAPGAGDGLPAWLSHDAADLVVRIKAVPGASRTHIAGALGDCLKVRVSAPPEGGRANAALVQLLAEASGVSTRAITLAHGQTQARKVFRIAGGGSKAAASLVAWADQRA